MVDGGWWMLWTATYAVGVLLSGSETGKPHEVHNVVPLCARAVAGAVPMRNAFRDDRSRRVVVRGSAGSGSWSPPSFRRMMRQRLLEGDERYYEHVRCSELQIDLFRNRVGCTAADGLVGAADAPRLVVQGVFRFPRQCTCLRAFGFGFMHEGVNKSGVGDRKLWFGRKRSADSHLLSFFLFTLTCRSCRHCCGWRCPHVQPRRTCSRPWYACAVCFVGLASEM